MPTCHTFIMNIIQAFYLFSYFVVLHITFVASRCSINVRTGMHINPPLLVSPTNPPTYVYPKLSDPENIVLVEGQDIHVVCPALRNQNGIVKAGVILVNNKSIESNSEKIKCTNEGKFKIQNYIVDFADVSCESTPYWTGTDLRKSAQKCSTGEIYEIGYDLGDLGFLKTIELCHNVKRAKTLWSYAKIQPTNGELARFDAKSCKYFKAGSLYAGMAMSKAEPYKLQTAYDRLKRILGGNENVDTYLSPNRYSKKYLTKGHLIGRADKFYNSEQKSTYFFANMVPMWQAINGGNWLIVENYVRHLASSKQRELEVYAGGLGTLKLEGKDFTLYRSNKIPVPKVLFKCVVDREAKEGLCFLVANNPYINDNEVGDYVVCQRNQICDNVFKSHSDTKLGYLYCCNIEKFYEATKSELGPEELKPLSKFKEMKLTIKE